MSQYVNMESLQAAARDFGGGEPFDHAAIDDFFLPEVAAALEGRVPRLRERRLAPVPQRDRAQEDLQQLERLPRADLSRVRPPQQPRVHRRGE